MKYILAILLLATTLRAEEVEELWVSGTQANWINRKAGIVNRFVELTDYQTTNSTVTTNGIVYTTNYTHTVVNTNNMLHQINFGLTNSAGKNVWIWGYTTQKIGGWDVDNEWFKMRTFCDNVNGMECRRGVGLAEYMTLKGLGSKTNQWKVLNIPFVDDYRKAMRRKSNFRKRKK